MTTVYRAGDTEWLEIEDAVALAVEAGAGRIVAVQAGPDAAQRRRLLLQEGCEIHLHLLARTPEARSAAAVDLLAARGAPPRR